MPTQRHWRTLATGVLFIITGCLIFANPLWNMAFLGWFFAFCVFVDGIVSLADYLSHEKRSGWKLVSAILGILVGIGLLAGGLLEQASLVPFLLGFWLLMVGIGRIMLAVSEGKVIGKRATTVLLLSGVASVVFGLVVLANPLLSAVAVVYVIAVTFIVYGVLRIVEFFKTPAS
ncbi:HdeD family acid-resistance protein [Corynebacterium sp. 13CS0277]|uniref:HdeD family acid-resistance protein n=1 Tax=Corynebacterium sp. 13CS0277 TaxID=2071994 RepID=UPI001304B42B|nr:DUF308 domain-containing protein [Corynebacterium sp. 13CS0277]